MSYLPIISECEILQPFLGQIIFLFFFQNFYQSHRWNLYCIPPWPTIQDDFCSKLEQLSIKYRCSQQVQPWFLLQRWVTANIYSVEPAVYLGTGYLVLEDCRGALEAMPTGNIFAEYYDHEPSERGQPSSAFPFSFQSVRESDINFPF